MKSKRIMAALLCACVFTGCTGCADQMAEDISDTPGDITSGSEATDTAATTTQTTQPELFDGFPLDERAVGMCGGYLEGFDTFEVTSEDLVDGKWADVISDSMLGENRSPQLSWSPVEGAAEYAVYMIDTESNGWILMKTSTASETELPQGSAAPLTEYAGPHLSHGHTHNYEVYVIALRTPAERLKGVVNGANPKLESFICGLDIDAGGNEGNIIAYGKLTGTYSDIRIRDEWINRDRNGN